MRISTRIFGRFWASIREIIDSPAPKPTPTKPIEEKPKPVAPIVPDHEVEANRVPSTFPTNVKGELKYQKDNSQVSTYSNLFEKDVLRKLEINTNIHLKLKKQKEILLLLNVQIINFPKLLTMELKLL